MSSRCFKSLLRLSFCAARSRKSCLIFQRKREVSCCLTRLRATSHYDDVLQSIRERKTSISTSSAISHSFSLLRKAANHPLLLLRRYMKNTDDRYTFHRALVFGKQCTVSMVKEELLSNYSTKIHTVMSELVEDGMVELRDHLLPERFARKHKDAIP